MNFQPLCELPESPSCARQPCPVLSVADSRDRPRRRSSPPSGHKAHREREIALK